MIPLTPLKLGDIFGGAFGTLGRYWKQLFGVGAAVYGGALAVLAVTVVITYSVVSGHLHTLFALNAEEDPRPSDVIPVMIGFGVVWLIGMIAYVISTAMMYAAVPTVLQEAVLGRPASFSAVWRRAWSRVPTVIATVILTYLIAMVPMLLMAVGAIALIIGAITMSPDSGATPLAVLGFLGAFASAPLAIWLWVKFSLAPSAAVFEGQSAVASMRRSARLVRGEWWRVFGISVLGGLLAFAASYIIQMPFSFLGMFSGVIGGTTLSEDPNATSVLFAMSGYAVIMALGGLVSQFITAVFPPLVTGLIYVDRRMRAENLGPALAEAAGVPAQYGAPYGPTYHGPR
ncbi:hypothetical protein ACFVWY_15245 [Streptomyces sp. NPDC058195]|uniref:DUF7847 domain-containing protein n=1 Tax=Streptomyces sp. NPDC058195 TaxID=3346375 RepID=UPI0036EE3364